MRPAKLLLLCTFLIGSLVAGAAHAQVATPPKDPETKAPPTGDMDDLWRQMDCDCECDCCARIKSLVKTRLKDPMHRPMLAHGKHSKAMRKSHRQRIHNFERAKERNARRGMRAKHRMHAKHGRRYRGEGKRRRAEMLDLTDEQREKIEQLRYDSRLDLIDLKAALKKRRLELRRMMRDGDASEKALREAVDAVAKARAEVEFLELKTKIDTRSVLTDEQRRKTERR